MTTVDKAHELFMSFQGRSPKKIYLDRCLEVPTRVNKLFVGTLSDAVDDFYHQEELNLSGNYFGPKGVMPVLPLLQSQQQLRKVNLSGCGVGDSFVVELVEILQDHPRLREVCLSNNPDISVFSAKGLVKAVKRNVNIIGMDLSNTHIGRNVAAVLQRLCKQNLNRLENYFADDFFRMKDVFAGLDVDGSAWVNTRNVVGSVAFPMVRERLEQRIAEVNPPQREDHCINVNTFLSIVYRNYKTTEEINDRARQLDMTQSAVVECWKALLVELTKRGAVCTELHRVRVREPFEEERLAAAVEEVVAKAKEQQQQQQQQQQEQQPSDAPSVVQVDVADLWSAVRHHCNLARAPTVTSPRTNIFTPNVKKSWRMPPKLVEGVVAAFRTAPSEGLPAAKVFELTFETNIERLKLRALRLQCARYSLPLQETLLTLQETVNMLDELYDVLRVNKPLTVEMISSLQLLAYPLEQRVRGRSVVGR